MSKRLVVCSLEPWDEIWRRNQFLVAGLLERLPDLEVLFVEPPHDALFELRRGHGLGSGRGLGETAVDRLRTFQPTKLLPRVAGPVADHLLRRDVRRAVDGLARADATWRHPVLWVNDPGWAGLSAATGWPTLYDITDDWLEADRSAREHARLVANERLLMERADVVSVCSPALAASKGALRPPGSGPVELVANAVELARYRTPMARPADLPAGPLALYVGTLHEDRLDIDLTVATARALGTVGGTLVLVGPNALSAENRARLEAAPHLAVLGPRPYAAVPAYLQHASTLVVPHVVDAFTETLDPIKLYEYLAVGRPVVATPVAGFREAAGGPVAGPITVAPRAEFASAVLARIGAPAPAAVVDVPDWSLRIAQMEKLLAPLWC